ncbi:MAG: hypothetical protein GF370_03190 [Candidatus Nealsonbacteria bacterium]|nr:hypothetical protein [Candidatus Nealsonbacteria bacterium]
MEKTISKEELDEIKAVKGKVRGLSMLGHAKFLLKEEGETSLEMVEGEMQKLGYDFHYDRIKKLKFYPLSLYCTELLVIQRIFDYDNEKFKTIGEFNSKNSIIVRLFMKYFVSLGSMAKQMPRFWQKYFTVGQMTVPDYNEKERFVVARLDSLKATPLFCEVARGFSSGMCQMITGTKGSCEEMRCVHRGDDCHEYLFKW